MGVAVRRSAVPRRPSNRQGVLRQPQKTLDRSADHGARIIHGLSLWNANVHARTGWKKRRPLTAKTGHASWQKDRLPAVSPKFQLLPFRRYLLTDDRGRHRQSGYGKLCAEALGTMAKECSPFLPAATFSF